MALCAPVARPVPLSIIVTTMALIPTPEFPPRATRKAKMKPMEGDQSTERETCKTLLKLVQESETTMTGDFILRKRRVNTSPSCLHMTICSPELQTLSTCVISRCALRICYGTSSHSTRTWQCRGSSLHAARHCLLPMHWLLKRQRSSQ